MQPDKNPAKIRQMFDEISPYYDKVNDVISFGSHYIIKSLAIRMLDIKKSSKILDICCGTGDFTKIIKKLAPNSEVIGLDFSEGMLEKAKKRLPDEKFIHGDCTNIPFDNEEFDIITVGFGLRNVQNRKKALEEAFRVLKSNGEFLHLDFSGGGKILSGKVFDFVVPLFVKFLGKNSQHYKYLLDSKNNYPSPEKLKCEFECIGFHLLKSKTYLFGAINTQIFIKPD